MPIEITPVTVNRTVEQPIECNLLYLPLIHIDDPQKSTPSATLHCLPYAIVDGSPAFANKARIRTTKDVYTAAGRIGGDFAACIMAILAGGKAMDDYYLAREAELDTYTSEKQSAQAEYTSANQDVQDKQALLNTATLQLQVAKSNNSGVDSAQAAVISAQTSLSTAITNLTNKKEALLLAQQKYDVARLAAADAANPTVDEVYP